MEPKIRGIVNIIGALAVGYLAYTDQYKWAIILLAVMFLIAGYHHVSRK